MKPTPKPSRKGWPLGKPRKPGVPLASTWIQLRVTKARKAAYERAARAKGQKLSPWALGALDREAGVVEAQSVAEVATPAKPLKIWNGRGHGDWDRGHFFVCAESRCKAARLLCLATRPSRAPISREIGQMDREIKVYYAEGSWGNSMEGITPEIGVWAQRGYHDKPVKIV